MTARVLVVLVALAILGALSMGAVAASGLVVAVADPPFVWSVRCPSAPLEAEGTVPCD